MPKTTSLETSKKLKELGLVNQSECMWVQYATDCEGPRLLWKVDHRPKKYTGTPEKIPALLADEVLELLPKTISYDVSEHGTRDMGLTIGKTIINNGYYVMYCDPHPLNKVPVYSKHHENLAEAAALLLIHLHTEGLTNKK